MHAFGNSHHIYKPRATMSVYIIYVTNVKKLVYGRHCNNGVCVSQIKKLTSNLQVLDTLRHQIE